VVLAMTVFSLLYGLERGSWLKAGGIGLGLLGLLLLALPGLGGEYASLQVIAIGVTVLGALAYGWGSVLLQIVMHRYSPFEMTGWQMLLGGMVLLLLSLPIEPPLWTAWLKPPVLAGLMYMVLASSILAFSLNNYLLSVWPASRVASNGFIIPVIALVIGVGALGEQIGGLEGLACGLLLLSTFVVQRADHRL
jgi:drug/metabolite transporter (DMT)-like permease